MSTNGHPDQESDTEFGSDADIAVTAATAIESAGFVRVITRADGDALAASGLLTAALSVTNTPFQVTVGRTIADRTERATRRTNTDADADADTGDDSDELTVVFGTVDEPARKHAIRLDSDERPATLAAADTVRELGSTGSDDSSDSSSPAGTPTDDPTGPEPTLDPVLALAGLVAAGVDPGAGESEWVLESARERGLVERRPGVAVPTADPVDGLAHSTRLRAPWSGDLEATREALSPTGLALDQPETFDGDDHRTLGSLVALDVVGADDATETAATSIQRVLRPYAITSDEYAFATVGGYAAVLEATARAEPGTGAALAMGLDAREPALAAWRAYGSRAHAALESASMGRYDGLFVVGIDDGPVEAVAQIALAYRSPEPTVLAVGSGEAALATRETGPGSGSIAATVEAIVRDLADDGVQATYDVGHRRGYLRFGAAESASDADPDSQDAVTVADDSTIIAAVRGHY
ncbi:exonuclease [Natrialba sp. SSL1]|uniref:exonuclease n=1 Tax=Natrialba sp. SSL1 TaxID=1869245 RepID=UPI0008F7E6C8|nr:exonuclease [Natrialba sp. SSL1]OIB58653.1 exonuclease [Natrialba sp. SSL1]